MKRSTFNLSNALFILPNAFTVASIFCATFALVNLITSNTQYALYQSSIALFIAAIFDMFDGRIARLTKTQSEFGLQFDSLADVISFGVAPALIAYRWALMPLDYLGLAVVFIYVACGAIRLARFNIISKQKAATQFFTGLPIPLSGGLVSSIVIAHYKIYGETTIQNNTLIACLILTLSLLMVSTFKFWTFKELSLGRSIALFLAVVATLFIGSQFVPVSAVFAAMIVTYISAGLCRTLLKLIGAV